MATKSVRSREGDTVDQIAARCYDGDTTMTVAILEANPGLADLGPIVPRGTLVSLPAKKAASAEITNLWD